MAKRRADPLLALYQRVPKLECRGLCAESCNHAHALPAEAERLRRLGKPVPSLADRPCRALTAEGRCSIYAHRPLICRLWGAVATMRCPWGCRPTGEYLSHEEGQALLNELRR